MSTLDDLKAMARDASRIEADIEILAAKMVSLDDDYDEEAIYLTPSWGALKDDLHRRIGKEVLNPSKPARKAPAKRGKK